MSRLVCTHLNAETPTDYRSCFPARQEQPALALLIDALYEQGIALNYTATGSLSTTMTEAGIDRMAEVVSAGWRRRG